MAFPKIETCIVCEIIRPEVLNKFSLLGFFGITPYVHVTLKDVRLPAALTFVFCAGSGEGKFTCDLLIRASDGRVVPNSWPGAISGELKKERAVTSIFMAFIGAFGASGAYEVVLNVDGRPVYSTRIHIDEGELEKI